MDPLIRKVNGDNEIEGLNIGFNSEYIDKVCGYADDLVFIIKECRRSIKKLFKAYHSFSQISGIELKTHPFTPYSGFTPGTSVFTHYTSARRRYAPHDLAMKSNSKI